MPEYPRHERAPDRDPDERIALERFRQFYRPNLLDAAERLRSPFGLFTKRGETAVRDGWKHAGSEDDAHAHVEALKRVPTREIVPEYWQLHDSAYLRRLDALRAQLPDAFVTDDTRLVVVIAAMNETRVDRAVDAVSRGYEGTFERDVRVLVYHNYKSEPDADVRAALDAVARRPNAFVVNERVGAINDVTMAKKVATDVAQRALGDDRPMPLLLTDADVVDLTEGAVTDGLAVLSEPGILATTPGYDYNPELRARFPVLRTLWDVERNMRTMLLAHGLNRPSNNGQFTLIDRAILAAVGGLKPVATFRDGTLRSSHFEDAQLRWDLRQLDNDRTTTIYPLQRRGHTVYTDASRELADLARGHRHDARWSNESRYESVSGTRRDAPEIPADSGVPEFGELTDANLCHAINGYVQSHYESNPNYAFSANEISRLLLQVLVDMGMRPQFTAVPVYEDPANPRGATEADLLKTNNWKIGTFTSVIG